MPLNATGLSAKVDLAGDDAADIYLNGVWLGQEYGAGAADAFDGNDSIQSGINMLAVQLLTNRHGGHESFGGQDHIGLLFNLGAAYTGLRPFASAPSTVLAGQTVTFTVDDLALGGRQPYKYKINYGRRRLGVSVGQHLYPPVRYPRRLYRHRYRPGQLRMHGHRHAYRHRAAVYQHAARQPGHRCLPGCQRSCLQRYERLRRGAAPGSGSRHHEDGRCGCGRRSGDDNLHHRGQQ